MSRSRRSLCPAILAADGHSTFVVGRTAAASTATLDGVASPSRTGTTANTSRVRLNGHGASDVLKGVAAASTTPRGELIEDDAHGATFSGLSAETVDDGTDRADGTQISGDTTTGSGDAPRNSASSGTSGFGDHDVIIP